MAETKKATAVAPKPETTAVATPQTMGVEQFAALFDSASNCDVSSAICETSLFFKPEVGVTDLYLVSGEMESTDNPLKNRPQDPDTIECAVIYDRTGTKHLCPDAVIISTVEKMRTNGTLPAMCYITLQGEREAKNGNKYNAFDIRRVSMTK